jgi:hypothetical protein
MGLNDRSGVCSRDAGYTGGGGTRVVIKRPKQHTCVVWGLARETKSKTKTWGRATTTRTHLGQVVVDVVLVQGVVGWHEGIIDIVSGGVDDRQLGHVLTRRLQGTWGGWGRGPD